MCVRVYKVSKHRLSVPPPSLTNCMQKTNFLMFAHSTNKTKLCINSIRFVCNFTGLPVSSWFYFSPSFTAFRCIDIAPATIILWHICIDWTVFNLNRWRMSHVCCCCSCSGCCITKIIITIAISIVVITRLLQQSWSCIW